MGVARVTAQRPALSAGSSPVLGALQMVFYIEACESGSMMNHLPNDINGMFSTGRGWLSLETAYLRPSVPLCRATEGCLIRRRRKCLWPGLVSSAPQIFIGNKDPVGAGGGEAGGLAEWSGALLRVQGTQTSKHAYSQNKF